MFKIAYEVKTPRQLRKMLDERISIRKSESALKFFEEMYPSGIDWEMLADEDFRAIPSREAKLELETLAGFDQLEFETRYDSDPLGYYIMLKQREGIGVDITRDGNTVICYSLDKAPKQYG